MYCFCQYLLRESKICFIVSARCTNMVTMDCFPKLAKFRGRIGDNIHHKNDSQISELLLFGVSLNNDASNICILNATIQYILATKMWHLSYLLLSHLSNSHFSIDLLTLLPPTIVHTRINDNWLFVSFFCYCHYYFSPVFF